MNPIEFEQQTDVFGKDQAEYNPLPSHVSPGGIVTSCWRLNDVELAEVKRTGVVWVSQLTFCTPLQPIILQAFMPFIRAEAANDGQVASHE